MKKLTLNDEDMQSLKTSLLAFVKRIAFHGTQSEEEARAFFPIVYLLLGISVALDVNLDDLSEEQEDEAGYDDSEKIAECVRRHFKICKHE